nr:hypothetical protein [Tanacetum cinerariifolium]
NDHFFWVDDFACPACFLWHTTKNVTRDPAPIATDFNAQDYATLVAQPSLLQKFSEEFLCLVGLSRHYTLDEETYPLFLDKDGEVAPGLGESELDVSVEKLFDEGGSGTQTEQGDSAGGVGGQGINIQPVIETTDIVAEDVIPLSAVQRLFAGAVHNAKVKEAKVDSFARPSVPVITADTAITSTADPVVVVKEKIVKPFLFFVDSTSAGGIDPAMAAYQMSLSVEVWMHAEYNISDKSRAVEKSVQDEVNALNGRNIILKKECNALDDKVMDLEAALVHELHVSFFKLKENLSNYDNLMEQLEEFQDAQLKVVNDKFDKLYTDFVEMTLHLEEGFYPHLLTTIVGRIWLLTYRMELAVVKCLNSHGYLSSLGTAISKATGKAISKATGKGMQDSYKVLTFLLLAELKSNKDVSIDALMNIVCLEEHLVERLGLNESQPHVDQLMVLIHHSPSKIFVGASALSLALDVSDARVRRIRENIASHQLFLHGVFVPLAEPISAVALIGTEGTSDSAPGTTTALSITFISASSIPPISTDDYEVVHLDGQKGTLKCIIPTAESALFLNLYAPFPSASVTSYGPSHLGPSFPISSARLASLLWSTSAVLSVGMPVSAGMITSIPYVNENEVSSLLDFIIVRLPTTSGLDNTYCIGWYVTTIIGCAWKYLFRRLLACTKASTKFSIDVYFISGPLNALLAKYMGICLVSFSVIKIALTISFVAA